MANSTQNAAPATARISSKKQTLDDAYAPPANFLEIDVLDSQTHGVGKARYTDYEVRMRVRKIDLFFLVRIFIKGSTPFVRECSNFSSLL